MRDAYRVLVGKLEGLRAPEMSRHNQEDNSRMDFKSHEMECWGLDICGLGYGSLAVPCEYWLLT